MKYIDTIYTAICTYLYCICVPVAAYKFTTATLRATFYHFELDWGLFRTLPVLNVLQLLCFSGLIGGQNVVVHVDRCYDRESDMTITAEYTGTDTFNRMEWFYSEQTAGNIVILSGTCTVFGAIGAGFPTPTSRISFQCPSTGLPEHNYTLTVEGVTQEELTNKRWGARFILDTSPSEQDEKNVTMCSTPTTAAPGTDGGRDVGFIAGICVGVVFLLFIIGCIVGCVKAALVEDKKNFKWILLSCIIIVGLGILTVMGIRGCLKKSDKHENPEKENSEKENMGNSSL